MTKKELSRFFDRVDIPTGANEEECWNWIGARVGLYGSFCIARKHVLAHRIIYEHCYGEIPLGYQVHHTCFNKSCVNYLHLVAVTRQENALASGYLKNDMRCKRGHHVTGENVSYYKRSKDGIDRIRCKLCSSYSQLGSFENQQLVNNLTDKEIVLLYSRLKPNGTA